MLNGIADKNTCNSEQKHSEWFVMLVCLTQMSIFQVLVSTEHFLLAKSLIFILNQHTFLCSFDVLGSDLSS